MHSQPPKRFLHTALQSRPQCRAPFGYTRLLGPLRSCARLSRGSKVRLGWRNPRYIARPGGWPFSPISMGSMRSMALSVKISDNEITPGKVM